MAFSIVRVLELTTTKLKVLFNDELYSGIGINNVSISSQIDSVSNPEIISVNVEEKTLIITFRPLFENVQYKVLFFSSDDVLFKTISGEVIIENNNRNRLFISSPGEETNVLRDSIIDDFPSIYDTEDQTLIRKLITGEANELQEVKDSIQTVKSNNYISVQVNGEKIARGSGPTDKLANGGAYRILRVADTSIAQTIYGYIEFEEERSSPFLIRASMYINPILEKSTLDPISLQSVDVIREIVTDDIDLNNHFVGLKIKVENKPVIQVISVSLKRGSQYTEYDIERFGYILKSSRYDTELCGTNLNLVDNEIELSSSSITGTSDGFVMPQAGDQIEVSYTYKKLGKKINTDSIELSSVKAIVRENAPALVTRFIADFSPIVSSEDVLFTIDGIEFLNTQATEEGNAFSSTHPAFYREIKYDVARFPAKIGEYSVNYTTGEVNVYGIDSDNDGTGENPPTMNYTYRKIYKNELDYNIDTDAQELSINSGRNISDIAIKISFTYENTYAEGQDYNVLSHIEELSERIDNRLISDFKIRTNKFPVTDVFRILNETTGELYNTTRFDDTTITFSGRSAPEQVNVTRERTSFVRIPQEILYVTEDLESSLGLRVIKSTLNNNNITDSQGRFIGANFDTSVIFSDTDIFIREFFFEDRLYIDVDLNLERLQQVGDYLIDYSNGIIYVAVSADQNEDLGDISYQHSYIETKNDHILDIFNIYRSISSLKPNVALYTSVAFSDAAVNVSGIETSGQRFINNDSSRVLLVGTCQDGSDGITTSESDIFTSNTGIFTSDDIGRTLVVGTSSNSPVEEVSIVDILNSHQLLVTPSIETTWDGAPWVILERNSGADKIISLDNDIVSVKNIYLVTGLGTLPAHDLDGYFDVSRDTISGNIITLGENNPLQIGDAIIVNYNYGDLYIDYKYLNDEIVISYEYGNNSLDWNISDSLSAGEEYYVSYKYGAMREALLTNFGALTQIKQLTNFSTNFDRETYRSILGGTLQSFVNGPVISSIERLVESFTEVKPNIKESAFNKWVLGRDNLRLRKPLYAVTPSYDIGKYENGIDIGTSQSIKIPAISHIKLNEGTIETWVRPKWNGLENDSTITFDLSIDGYSDPLNVYIGFSNSNPSSIPFDLSVDNQDISVLGEPTNIEEETGFFIWYDDSTSKWNLWWREDRDQIHEFTGTMTTTGEFFNVTVPTGEDGYYINESTDVITSTIKSVKFEAFIDGYDAEVNDEQYALDGITFSSGDSHYIFDVGYSESSNRMSLFKDGTGYLNFQVFDNKSDYGLDAGFYNISNNIRSWEENQLYHVAVSWKFNSVEEKDEMHLFVNGEETANLFKYGGNPKASSSHDFGDIAEEIVISSALKPIIGGFAGVSSSGSSLFLSEDSDIDFSLSGISVGDYLYILDDTADGTGSPNYSTAYTILGVGINTLSLDRALTLSLSNIKFSVNQITATVDTAVNYQDFIVVVRDSDGNETELNGINSDYPDYSIRRGSYSSHIISINNKISTSDSVLIKTLGLVFKKCKETIYVYGGGEDEIRTNSSPPVSLTDVKITPIILEDTYIQDGYDFTFSSEFIGSQLITLLKSNFDSVCQPSNSSRGRRLSIRLSGDNINYDVLGNNIVINGTTYSGNTIETISFSENDTWTTTEYWTYIDSIDISIVPSDSEIPAGSIQIKEYKPITESENNGDYAEVSEYSNGIFRLEIYGSGGAAFKLNACSYEIEYPSFLRIRLDKVPEYFNIGCNINDSENLNSIIDEFRILDYMSEDTRPGEDVPTIGRTVTTDYNSLSEMSDDETNTLLLLHGNNSSQDSSLFIDRFGSGYETSDSVNDNFELGIKFSGNRPYIINNAGSVFGNDEGTVEFWISPINDSSNDPNYHYYLDTMSLVEEITESSTSVTIISGQRIGSIESIRLISDIYNTGTNYAIGAKLSNIDRKTITLSSPLPTQNSEIKISYASVNNQGDRVSLFKDPYSYINFFVKASDVEHNISVHVDWERHTWHRVMAMWKTNSTDNKDRLRLFVDGIERGTIKYGTGLIYGTGVIYGQEEVRVGTNRFIVDNIDLTDVFAKIYIGSDVFNLNGANAVIDNIRFSDRQRLQSIRTTSTEVIDSNYNSNTAYAIPVVEDLYTTAIYNFDNIETEIEYLATLVNSEKGIFKFEVEVVDSFDKVIGNTELEELLIDLINTIKPAHTEAIITLVK